MYPIKSKEYKIPNCNLITLVQYLEITVNLTEHALTTIFWGLKRHTYIHTYAQKVTERKAGGQEDHTKPTEANRI